VSDISTKFKIPTDIVANFGMPIDVAIDFPLSIVYGGNLLTNGDMEAWPDVVVNGGFDDGTGWTVQANWAIAGGTANATGATGWLYQNPGTLTIGKAFRITHTISDYVGVSVRTASGNGAVGTQRNANGTYSEIITCSGSDYLLFDGVAAFTGKIDNVKAELQEPSDWTVTENGTGTVRQEDTIVNEGSYSAKLYTPSGGGNTVSIRQDYAGVNGRYYKVSFDIRCDAIRTINVRSADPTGGVGTLNESYSIAAADTWYRVSYVFRWAAADNAVYIATNSNGSFYVDDIKLQIKE